MGWSYDDVIDLPIHVYDVLIEELTREPVPAPAAPAERDPLWQ